MLELNNSVIKQPVLGRWDLIEEIGHGKHGIVYKARDVESGGIAAIKIISLPNEEMLQVAKDQYGDNPAMIENFVGQVAENFGNEIESMKRLRDVDSVIKLYDNQLFQRGIEHHIVMVMEYAIPMKEYFTRNGLCVGAFLDFACDIALGLDICSQRNILHRDIKEDNLFVGVKDGIGKMGDFGIASVSETGLGSTFGMGTPYYMAPEVSKGMARDGNYNNTVDIYSLGIVLYKMLNGSRFPFVDRGVKPKDALDMRMNGEEVPFPKYAQNTELGRIVLKCCEYHSSKRFQSGRELYEALCHARTNMSADELDKKIPYINDEPVNDTPDRWSSPNRESAEKKEKRFDHTGTSVLSQTMDILQNIFSREGRNSTIASVFSGIVQAVTNESGKQIKEEQMKVQRRNIIILVSFCVAAVLALLVMLYPKTATFYSDTTDNKRIHVKYLFLPDRRITDIPSSYLSVNGNWLYFSNPEEDHTMYKKNIWFGDPIKLCEDDCEYVIVIGDYIYYTSFDEDEKLCRIKTDGTCKQYILDYPCRELKRNGNNIMFVLRDTNELKELDTSTID